MKSRKYLLNCFLLIIPLIVWNIILIDYLPKSYSPDVFDKDIPKLVSYSENFIRFILFALPVFMVLSLKSRLEKIGFIAYCLGLILYFSSWIIMIFNPESNWSQSLIGFMAPAYTTIIFFVGIGLVGNKAFFKIPYLSLVYIC
ncbi:MAG: hypothetical protein WBO32_04950, partial [Cyclobacteriaceae bacterium]